jgi:hypothetical protein
LLEVDMKIILSILCSCTLFLSSCASLQSERKVENNVFSSSYLPEICVSVNQEIEYIGCASEQTKYPTYEEGINVLVNHDSYIFGKKGSDNSIEQGVIIYFSKILTNKPYFIPDMFPSVKIKLISDIVRINSQDYQHVVYVKSHELQKYEADYIMNKGYIIPRCFMIEAFARREGSQDNNKMCIYYFESLKKAGPGHSCSEWVIPTTANQKAVIDDFLQRCKANMEVLNAPPQKQE